jgi:undecaprenyl diphosphate synthase
MPRHVAVIMDGNGRWAKNKGLPRVSGHKKGVEVVKNMVPICGKRGIPYLTLFAFSTENWKRPATEVMLLIDLLTSTLENEVNELHKHKVRLRVIGDVSRFPNRLRKAIKRADELCTRELPEPDLFIRTGGDLRISNFLLWQLAYTELYFTDTLWPDFDEAAFDKALDEFSRRQRRFGQTDAQLKELG